VKSAKFQVPSKKQMIMSKISSSKQNSFWLLEFGNWDLFGIWKLEFEAWDFNRIRYFL